MAVSLCKQDIKIAYIQWYHNIMQSFTYKHIHGIIAGKQIKPLIPFIRPHYMPDSESDIQGGYYVE